MIDHTFNKSWHKSEENPRINKGDTLFISNVFDPKKTCIGENHSQSFSNLSMT